MLNPRLRFCLAVHNHQPVGNFDDVIEQAYQDSYLPFLELFESQTLLSISLHTSGSLMLWLEQHHPEYLELLQDLVRRGRIEILGGAFYEPILSMIPSRDRQGQIRRYSDWLNRRFDTEIQGMWIPERVWEASLVSDLALAGIKYTVLDDFHFRRGGLDDAVPHGDFVTEDQGHLLRVLPGNETLRYLIPFRDPEDSLAWLRQQAKTSPDSIVVFADDGEKFGSWPDTRKRCYDDRWLARFFDALQAENSWLECTTLSRALANSTPRGRIWLPSASYREMTEWAMPVKQQLEFRQLARDMESDERWPVIRKFSTGGFWRNFRNRYPEVNEMYARMMHVSNRLQAAHERDANPSVLEKARDHLYRSQCNCAWWHGAFGGVYLPHLRNEVYHQLIRADNLIDTATGQRETPSIEAADFDMDLQSEVRMANRHLIGWFAPSRGGHLYELDIRDLGHNLLATMDRRPEACHEDVRRGGVDAANDQAISIHDRLVIKHENLERDLVYDNYSRKSLVDHFWPVDCKPGDIRTGTAAELGDFVGNSFETTIRRGPRRNQLSMSRQGRVGERAIGLTKGITLDHNGTRLEMAWLVEGLSPDQPLRFAVEFNFAGIPAGHDDRFFADASGNKLGQLGQSLVLSGCDGLSLCDHWLGLDARLGWDTAGDVWTFPVATVSQSESGIERIHQSVAVLPNWLVRGDANGRWAVKMELCLETRAHGSSGSEVPVAARQPDSEPV